MCPFPSRDPGIRAYGPRRISSRSQPTFGIVSITITRRVKRLGYDSFLLDCCSNDLFRDEFGARLEEITKHPAYVGESPNLRGLGVWA